MTWNRKKVFQFVCSVSGSNRRIDYGRCGMLKRMKWLSGGVLLFSLVLICVPVMASATQQTGGPTDALGGAPTPYSSGSTPSPLRLRGHVPTKALAAAKSLGGLASDTQISMAIVLPLRNQAELQELLGRIYDPVDPLYGHYLTPQEFTDRFGPTQADYDAVTAYARSLGFTITGTHPNRTLLDVSGPAGTVEAAFTLHLDAIRRRTAGSSMPLTTTPKFPIPLPPVSWVWLVWTMQPSGMRTAVSFRRRRWRKVRSDRYGSR